MRTTYKITDKLLFDRYVFDIDTSKLSSAYLGKRKEFLAEGDLFVWFIGEEDWSFVTG